LFLVFIADSTENLDQDIRVTAEELGDFAGDEGIVRLTDDSGYYVTVAAFHGLHCVRNLHKYLYAEHYYEGYSEQDLWTLKRHAGR
jgi:hypothetical protein